MQARLVVRILRTHPEILSDQSTSMIFAMRQDPARCDPAYRSAVQTVQNAVRSAMARLPERIQERFRKNMARYSQVPQPDRRTRRTQRK